MEKNFKIYHNEENGQFEILEGEHKAEIVYRINDGNYYIMHTGVPKEIANQGIGEALALHALKYGQKLGLQIVIYCPFVKVWAKRNSDWRKIEYEI